MKLLHWIAAIAWLPLLLLAGVFHLIGDAIGSFSDWLHDVTLR